jgi:hypothetical protein
MTQEENCAKCGKKIRLFKQAPTITQWLKTTSDCNCDSQEQLVSPFSSEYEDKQIVRCEICGKDRTPSRDGSLTQWIFKDNKCKCLWNELDASYQAGETLAVGRPEPLDEETRAVAKATEIDYHDLSENAFPFERYRIVREIGRGNAGIVFKCWDTFLRKRVAIKTLYGRTWSPEELVKLQNEARAASKLSHPNVVRVLDFGSSRGGQPFMVMDFVGGQTLQEVLEEQGAFEEYTALSIFSQLLAGIGHAHRHGVLHRDVKPSNILVIDALAETPQVKVIDFGIAALTNTSALEGEGSGKTFVTGSPAYMSPDQARGETFEGTSDIYSLGVVFYEVLTGENPFRGSNVLDSIARHANLEPPPFSEAAPDKHIDAELESIVRKMLAKEASERYQTTEEVRELVDGMLDRIDIARGGTRLKRRGASSNDENFFDGKTIKNAKAPDAMLYAIVGAGALFILSITILVMNRAAEDVLPQKREALPKAAGPVQLDDEVTKPNYIEDILLPNSKKNDAYLKSLVASKDVPKEINLRMSDVTDDGIKHIENLPIEFIDLSYTNISDKALESVSHMPKLSGIYLTGCAVTADGIKYLTNMNTLRFLDVSTIPASVELVRTAAQIPGVNRLYFINSPNINATNLKELEAAKSLEALALRRVPLKSDEVTQISKLKGVKTLLLSFCELTDDSVKPLVNLPKLEILDVSGNQIGDKAMQVLSKFKSLKELYIAHCQISPEAIDRFRKANGKCAVRLELGPTMLGSGQM